LQATWRTLSQTELTLALSVCLRLSELDFADLHTPSGGELGADRLTHAPSGHCDTYTDADSGSGAGWQTQQAGLADGRLGRAGRHSLADDLG